MLVEMLMSVLRDKRQEICTELNNMINVPLVSESKEQACIESIFDSVLEVLEKVLKK